MLVEEAARKGSGIVKRVGVIDSREQHGNGSDGAGKRFGHGSQQVPKPNKHRGRAGVGWEQASKV